MTTICITIVEILRKETKKFADLAQKSEILGDGESDQRYDLDKSIGPGANQVGNKNEAE